MRYRRDADQENEDIASDVASRLGQSEKETERQQDLNRQNQNIYIGDPGMVTNVNIARTNDDVDYYYYNYWAIQLYGIIIVENDKGKPITIYYGWVAKKSNLSKDDTSVAIKSPSKALTQWFGIGYNYETIRRSKTTLPAAIRHLNDLNKSAVTDKTESQSKQSNASHSTASQRSPKELTSPFDGENKSISPYLIPIDINKKVNIINYETLHRLINKALLLKASSLEIDLRNVTTLAEAVTSPRNKLAVADKTETQSKQSKASHSTASQQSPKELQTPIDGKREPIDPDDSCHFDIKKASKENLDSEPVVTDEPSGIDDSPIIVSTDKDEATSNGEESTDSDYDFEVMKLFEWLDKKDWARSYYDCDEGVVIHVEPGQVEVYKRLLSEEFPDFHKYSVVETEPGVCMYSADPFGEDKEQPNETNNSQTPNGQNPAATINTQQTEVHSPEEQLDTETANAQSLESIQSAEVGLDVGEEQLDTQTANTHSPEAEMGSQGVEFDLKPGDTIITSDEHLARFSGRVGSKGLTVAHIGPLTNNIYHYSNDRRHLVGTIIEKVPEVKVSVTHRGETASRRTTADLGLLELTPQCRVKNIICVKDKESYKLKLYTGSISKGISLRIIDQNGNEKHGKLVSDSFTLKRKGKDSSLMVPKEDDLSREVYNMLLIQNEKKSAISAKGDSGTLVTTIPKEGSNEVFVYGIVTHLHKEGECDQPSATIANRLSDILDAIDSERGESVGLRDPSSKKIDFTEDEN